MKRTAIGANTVPLAKNLAGSDAAFSNDCSSIKTCSLFSIAAQAHSQVSSACNMGIDGVSGVNYVEILRVNGPADMPGIE